MLIIKRIKDQRLNVDGLLRNSRFTGSAMLVLDQFKSDHGSERVATITYYAFLSLLPLLVAILSLFDLLFRHDEELHRRLINSTLTSIPILGTTLNQNLSFVRAHGVALIISLLTLLWSARRGAIALENALCEINTGSKFLTGSWFSQILRAYVTTALVGIGVMTPTLLSSAVNNEILRFLAIIPIVLWNSLILWLLYRSLVKWPMSMLRGAIVGGILLTLVQQLSVVVLRHTLDNSRPLFGTLSVVLVLLLWISLQVRATLYGAEVNNVYSQKS